MSETRPVWLTAAAVLVCLAARVMWLAWSFYFGGAPRYPLESGAIALVATGALIVLLRSGDRAIVDADRDHVPVGQSQSTDVSGLPWLHHERTPS